MHRKGNRNGIFGLFGGSKKKKEAPKAAAPAPVAAAPAPAVPAGTPPRSNCSYQRCNQHGYE